MQRCWCKAIKDLLDDNDLQAHWRKPLILKEWKTLINGLTKRRFDQQSTDNINKRPSLELFRQIKQSNKLEQWLNRGSSHPGVILRTKLRCGALPLMDQVGASMKWPRELRHCMFCDKQCIETAQHFVAECPFYADLRTEAVRRINATIANQITPQLKQQLTEKSTVHLTRLFLSDALLTEIQPEAQAKVDDIALNFLKLAWRKRERLWSHVCKPDNPWRLA